MDVASILRLGLVSQRLGYFIIPYSLTHTFCSPRNIYFTYIFIHEQHFILAIVFNNSPHHSCLFPLVSQLLSLHSCPVLPPLVSPHTSLSPLLSPPSCLPNLVSPHSFLPILVSPHSCLSLLLSLPALASTYSCISLLLSLPTLASTYSCISLLLSLLTLASIYSCISSSCLSSLLPPPSSVR